MTAWIVCGGVIAYLAVGSGFARLWAHLNDYKTINYYADLRAEMIAIAFLWPALVPVWLVIQLINWAIFPERMR